MGHDLSYDERVELHRQLIKKYHSVSMEYAVEVLEGSPLIDAPHHEPISRALNRVFLPVGHPYRISRLIINIPPGYGKTMAAVWSFVSRGFVVNPAARFIHTSSGADLALDNSTKIREIIESELMRAISPMQFRQDSKAKGLWRNEQGGGIRVSQTGGSIVGFRAGRMDAEGEFSGAFVVDDPLKPDDARSRKKAAVQNQRYNTTIKSRLATEDVPIIVVMQRLCAFTVEDGGDVAESGDLSEFLLRGGSGEVWNHLWLPVEIDNSIEYPSQWTHGSPVPHNLPDGMLWDVKHTEEGLSTLERSDKYVCAAQYRQLPKMRTGDPIIEAGWFKRYRSKPEFKTIRMYADTANKTGESNDYSVFLVAGLTHDGRVYILDVLRFKVKIPDLLEKAEAFWDKWKLRGATRFKVEDAQSGTFLIQALEKKIGNTVVGIQRNKDKFTRVNGIVTHISDGNVYVPANSDWVDAFVAECEEFTDDDSHKNDDQVDTLADAIEDLLGNTLSETTQRAVASFY